MVKRTKPTIVSVTLSLSASVWAVYYTYSTAKDLPADASSLERFFADPPIYLPEIILLLSILALALSFWPSKQIDDRELAYSHDLNITGNSPNVIINHHYGDQLRLEVAAVSQQDVTEATLPSVTVSPPNSLTNSAAVRSGESSTADVVPATSQAGGQLAPLTSHARAFLFPRGLYVGTIIVSASNLANDGALEIGIRGYNGTELGLRVFGAAGQIQLRIGQSPSLPLPYPAFRPDSSVVQPGAEFLVVLEQRIPPNMIDQVLEAFAADGVRLDFRQLNITVEDADARDMYARLPLWDAVAIRRRDDLSSSRNYILDADGITATGRGVASLAATVTRADGRQETRS